MNGLHPFTVYSFKVSAVNSVGESGESEVENKNTNPHRNTNTNTAKVKKKLEHIPDSSCDIFSQATT